MNKVLLIEDDAALNENLGFILNKNKFDLMSAENGKTGIELFGIYKPDAVICDIMLPDIDGYKIIKTIRKDGGNKNIPFLFISAKSAATDLEKGMELGAADYLVKPFKVNKLLNSLNHLFEKKSISKGNILILNNDASYSIELAFILEKNLYKCHISSTANSVIELAEFNKIDLIICGLALNDIDGSSVIRKVKENNSTRNIPIIILGSEYNSFFSRKVINMGADDYLNKSFDLEEVLRVVDSRISRVRTAKAAQLKTINNILLPNKKINYYLSDQPISERTENITGSANHQTEAVGEIFKPALPVDNNDNLRSIAMNHFLLNRNIAKDYEQFIHRGITVVFVNINRADLKESLIFQKYLSEIMQNNLIRILVDMSLTNFMDSSFTGVLIQVGRKLKLINNGELRLVINTKSTSTNPILLDRLGKNIKIYENLDLALNCFNAREELREVHAGKLNRITNQNLTG